MHATRKEWKIFQCVFIVIQALVIFFTAHFVLSANEEEGFFEIFTVKNFLPQFFVQVLGLSLLAIALEWMNKKAIERFYGEGAWKRKALIYVFKALLLPVVFTFIFAYFYFSHFRVSFDVTTYMNQLWPFFLGFFAFINVLLLLKLLLEKVMFSKQSVASSTRDADGANDIRIEVSINRKKEMVRLNDIGLCVREDRNVAVYLLNGRSGFSAESIASIKARVGNDPKVFATGSWLVHSSFVADIKDGQSIRSKELLVKIPIESKLIIPKERVSEFTAWYDSNRY